MNTLGGLSPLETLALAVACGALVFVWEWLHREPPTPPPPAVAAAVSSVERDMLLHRVGTIHPGWSAAQIEAEATLIETPPVEAEPSARERHDRAIAAYVRASDELNAATIELRNTTHLPHPLRLSQPPKKP